MPMILSTDRFYGDLTLGDTIFFAAIVGGLILAALVILVRGYLDFRRSQRRG